MVHSLMKAFNFEEEDILLEKSHNRQWWKSLAMMMTSHKSWVN